MPRMNWQGSLEDMRACIELRRAALVMHQRKNFRLSRNDFIFFFLAVFQGQLDSHFFFSCFTVVRAERMALYTRRCFSFRLDCMHLPYNEDKLTTLHLQAS